MVRSTRTRCATFTTPKSIGWIAWREVIRFEDVQCQMADMAPKVEGSDRVYGFFTADIKVVPGVFFDVLFNLAKRDPCATATGNKNNRPQNKKQYFSLSN
jgi:hypothetical protein